MKKQILALLAALVLCLTLLPAAVAEEMDGGFTYAYVYTTNRGPLKVRRDRSTKNDSNVITKLDYGTEVTVLGTYDNGTWTEISVRKEGGLVNGYVMSRYLSFTPPSKSTTKPVASPTPLPSVATLAFDTFKQVTPYAVYANPSRVSGWVNLRWAPSTAVEVVERCPLYYQLVVISENKSWAQAYDPATGVVGFISRSFIKPLGYNVVLSTMADLPEGMEAPVVPNAN